MPRAKKKVEEQTNDIENAAPANEVDDTVKTQEGAVGLVEDRTPESEKEQDEDSAIKNAAPANDVDEPVENQMNPGLSEKDRSEDDSAEEEDKEATKAWDTLAPAQKVDETVENQMNPGINMVDRTPDRQIVADSAGITYDVSKSYPELVDPEREANLAAKGKMRHDEAVLNAKDFRKEGDENDNNVSIEFVNTGLSALGHVWRAGETVRVAKDKIRPWMKQSESEQEERYGKVMFKVVK
jgi:hypothetical protein